MPVGDLAIRLRADTAAFESDMGRAAHVSEKEMERMITRANVAGDLIGRAISGIAGHFTHMIGETLKLGDELAKFKQRSAFSVEFLSELSFAGQLADVSLGQLKTGIGFFEKALAEAQKETTRSGQVFRALGVDINAGPQVAFEQLTKAINTLPDGETKVAAMKIAFGRAGDAMIPLLSGLDEAREKARNLGIVMSEQVAKDSERFNDAMVTLKASSGALALTLAGPAASALATMAENMVKSREQNTAFKDTFIEIGKVVVATVGTIGSYVPLIGKYTEEMADRAFHALDRLKGLGDGAFNVGEFSPVPKGLRGALKEAPVANRLAAACTASGGQWVNGQCQYKRPTAGARGRTPRDESERVAREMARGEEELAKEVAEAWSFVQPMIEKLERFRVVAESWDDMDFTGMTVEEAEAWARRRLEALTQLADIEDRGKRVAAGFTEDGKAIESATKKADDWAKQLGLTFSSAFEDAVLHGKKLRDVLQGIATDIARMILRKQVTEPLANAIGGLKFGDLFERIFGGGSSGGEAPAPGFDSSGVFVGSFASGTPFVQRTGLAMVHQGERIIPAGDNSGRAVIVNQTVYVDSRSDAISIRYAMAVARQEAVGALEDRQRRSVR